MNKVLFMGRLTADPEFSQSQSGTAICKFRIAIDRTYTKQGEEKQSDFFQITAFGKTAEHVSKYFIKGKPILVEGRIQNNNYTAKDGKTQYRDTIIADNVSFLLSDPTRNGNGNQQTAPQNQQYGYNNGYQGNQGGYNQQYAPPVQNPQYQPPMQNYQQSAPAQQNQNEFSEFEQISDGQLPF